MTPLNSKTITHPVSEGPLPLVYLIGTDGTASVTDQDSKQTLASFPVMHNTTIAVDSGRGVIVAGKVVHAGPLVATDHYAIFYSVTGEPDQFISATETNDPAILREKTKLPADSASDPGNPLGQSPTTASTTPPPMTPAPVTPAPVTPPPMTPAPLTPLTPPSTSPVRNISSLP